MLKKTIFRSAALAGVLSLASIAPVKAQSIDIDTLNASIAEAVQSVMDEYKLSSEDYILSFDFLQRGGSEILSGKIGTFDSGDPANGCILQGRVVLAAQPAGRRLFLWCDSERQNHAQVDRYIVGASGNPGFNYEWDLQCSDRRIPRNVKDVVC